MRRLTAASRAALVLGCLLGRLLAGSAAAGDWPQYRYDAHRSAASPETLPTELSLRWVRELPPPQPAFPSEARLNYDLSYEPVVLDGTMFIPSMVADSVTALDAETGEERWVFFTDGPVRFAPAAGKGKVYVASDDGWLYCLDARQGGLLWKFRGLPAGRQDRKVLGHGRLISLWPARGGPLLEDGVVYFAAGLWPQDGVFLHALDAETGAVVWSNTTSDQIESANVDHGVSQFAGLTPQGYLARVHDKLVVPCGAQLPAFLDPKTGKLGTYTMGWGGRNGLPKGTWLVAGAGEKGKYLSHGGDLYDISRPADVLDHRGVRAFMTEEVTRLMYPGGWTRLLIDPANQRALNDFRKPVITEEAIYYNDLESGIAAYDLTEVKALERSEFETPRQRAKDPYPDKWKGVFQRLWSLPSDLEVHIKAGDRLYAAGKGTVQAIDLPKPGGGPQVSWSATLEGVPHSLLAADGKLFVTTREGRIYAFAGGPAAEVAQHRLAEAKAPAPREPISPADDPIEAAGVHEGYALVLGVEDGRLVEDLLQRTKLTVIAIDPSEERVGRLRERLHREGLYGVRAAAHVGDPLTYEFPPYLASLVVSERPAQLGPWRRPAVAAALFHVLRPYGGTACLPVDGEPADALIQALGEANLAGASVRRSGGWALLTREGPLPEAAPWSHEGGDASNAVASQDRCVKPPLDVLWFDSSFRWNRKPGSAVVRVAGGRVLVKSDELLAIDAFTGRRLWTAALPKALTTGAAEMVAVEDGVYLAAADKPCRVFDPATGERAGAIPLPQGVSGSWANLRVWEDYLAATAGAELFCMNRRTKEVAWRFTCGRSTLAVAVGNGKVFCCELLERRKEASAEQAGTLLRAFDIATGKPLWQAPCGEDIHYAAALDWVVTRRDMFHGRDGSRLRDGVASPQIAGTRLVSGSTDRFTLFDLASPEAPPGELAWFRRGCTDLRSSPHLVTTRYRANAAYVDLASLEITPLWNIRPGCASSNNLYPADGLLNVPNITGGCECNYTPVSKAFAPRSVIARPRAGQSP